MVIDKELVLQLRQETGKGMLDCKKALEESEGDIEQAKIILEKRWEFTKLITLITYR